MADEPVDLDEHRDRAALRATELRRQRRQADEADQDIAEGQEKRLEEFLLASPAEGWPDAAAKAKYLIELFAATPEAQDPRRKDLIAQTLGELDRLCDKAKDPS